MDIAVILTCLVISAIAAGLVAGFLLAEWRAYRRRLEHHQKMLDAGWQECAGADGAGSYYRLQKIVKTGTAPE